MLRPRANEASTVNVDQDRRGFFQHVAGMTAGLALTAATSQDSQTVGAEPGTPAPSLPTVTLGPHQISRLIVGGNPIYGHSHFNWLYSRHLREYHTPERVVELLRACQAAGINTWQNSYEERTLDDIELVRRAGIGFHWLCLGKPDWASHPERIERAASRRPIGIAPHGVLAERLHRQKKVPVLLDQLKRIRATGVLVGLSAHNPALIELAEDRDWDVDYYMCSQYYLTRPREEFREMLGEVPMGEVYLPSDADRMFEVIRAVRKPCLIYKVLAAGRANLSAAGIREAFQFTLSHIKSTDAMIVGMFQEFGDQVGMNARFVRELSVTRS